jgi:thiol-disulfide isomerase/thioredoxin
VNTLNLILPLIERFGWALLIIAAGLALYWLANRAILNRAQKNGASQRSDLPFDPRGLPAILYFTTPECQPCKTIQRPALQRLQDRLGSRLQVVEVDAQERPDLASRWGVLSVPTTFIIDSSGQLRHVNHGVTRAEKLMQQLEPILK